MTAVSQCERQRRYRERIRRDLYLVKVAMPGRLIAEMVQSELLPNDADDETIGRAIVVAVGRYLAIERGEK